MFSLLEKEKWAEGFKNFLFRKARNGTEHWVPIFPWWMCSILFSILNVRELPCLSFCRPFSFMLIFCFDCMLACMSLGSLSFSRALWHIFNLLLLPNALSHVQLLLLWHSPLLNYLYKHKVYDPILLASLEKLISVPSHWFCLFQSFLNLLFSFPVEWLRGL